MANSSIRGQNDWQTTHWSVVISAQREKNLPPDQWQHSLAELCQAYWYPLYAYLRRKGYKTDDAQDLTQDFFASLIEKDFLKAIDPDRGRFRWFLMDAISKFAANWNAAQSTKKRGGDRQFFSLRFDDVETRYLKEPTDGLTPEKLFNRRWALTVLDSAINQLQNDYEQNGKTRFFEHLHVFLTADSQIPSYAEVAEKLGLTETAVKVAIHRLREKYRNTIRQLLAQTLEDPASLDDEIDDLMSSL